MAAEYDFSDDIAHHVLKVLRPLHQAKRELDFLTRYTTMTDEGVPRYVLTQGQLERIADILTQLRKSFYNLDQAHHD